MIFRAMNGVFAFLFLVGVLVQYNDPDPIQWMAIYGAAATLSLFAALRPGRAWAWAPWVVALIALAWGTGIGAHALGRVPFASMFQSWEMKNVAIEENRETYGLFIIAAWMIVLGVVRLRQGRR